MAEREGTARFRKRKNSSKKIIEELKKKVQDSSQITKGLKKYSKEINI